MASENSNKRKRRRGEGTVFKRNGMWAAEASLGRKPDGSRLRVTVYAKTIAELNAKLAQAKREALSKSPATRKTMTVSSLLDEWYESAKTTVTEGTAIGYDEHVRLHLKPALGAIRLIDLETSHVSGFVRNLGKGDEPLSAAMIRKVFRTLRAAITFALDHEYLANPDYSPLLIRP